jgi:hypothetical protein
VKDGSDPEHSIAAFGDWGGKSYSGSVHRSNLEFACGFECSAVEVIVG